MLPIDSLTLPIKVARFQHMADLKILRQLLQQRKTGSLDPQEVKRLRIESQRHHQERKSLYKASIQGARVVDTYIDTEDT